jgi:hypothetical protein
VYASHADEVAAMRNMEDGAETGALVRGKDARCI